MRLLLRSEIAKDLRCNLCAYDYTGYGRSAGRPSVPDTLADIDAVFAWLLRRGVRRQDIVLYGQSLGSGPTLYLAAKEATIAGVCLHAAFASGACLYSCKTRFKLRLGVRGNRAKEEG